MASLGDNEQYRVNLSAEEATRVTSSSLPEIPETTSSTEETPTEDNADVLILKALEEEQRRTSKGKRQTGDIEFKEVFPIGHSLRHFCTWHWRCRFRRIRSRVASPVSSARSMRLDWH